MKRNIKRGLSNFSIVVIIIVHWIIILPFKKCNAFDLKNKIGTIQANIRNFNGSVKSGKFVYFDAIGRILHNDVFLIDSTGNFKVYFKIPHPILNVSYLYLQGNTYSLFLEPGKDLRLIIDGKSIIFPEDNGLSNSQLILLEDSINKKFNQQIEYCKWLHTKNVSFQDYMSAQSNLANKKLEFIDKFGKKHNINKKVIDAEKKNAFYAQAKSWICFRFDYSSGIPRKRDTLIYKDFYNDLFKNFPINDRDALVSREFIDYISNIKDVFSENESFGSKIDFIKSKNQFSKKEISLIEGVIKDCATNNSSEFKKFMTDENLKKLNDLNRQYLFRNILMSCKTVPRGIGRDLIITQSLCNFYLSKTFIEPTKEEWKSIEKLIDNNDCIDYCRDLFKNTKIKISGNYTSNEIPKNIHEASVKLINNLVNKYYNKVVFIDFWAPWCIPCMKEMPYSKELQDEYKNKEVVFLFLANRCKEDSWKTSITNQKLSGEHVLLNDDQFDILSAEFGIDGIPHYVLIDKKGNIVLKSASRPSQKDFLKKQIDKLL